MRIELKRFFSGKNDTMGMLLIDWMFVCFTLEDEKREVKVPGETRIPEGTYPLTLRFSPSHSPRYGHDMIAVNNVPGFTGILIHKGNTEKDTAGCPLVGNMLQFKPGGNNYLGESTLAYDRIYPIISEAIKKEPTYLIVS